MTKKPAVKKRRATRKPDVLYVLVANDKPVAVLTDATAYAQVSSGLCHGDPIVRLDRVPVDPPIRRAWAAARLKQQQFDVRQGLAVGDTFLQWAGGSTILIADTPEAAIAARVAEDERLMRGP